MKITHRASAPASASTAVKPLATPAPEGQEVPRLSCVCRLSELLPLVRQAHEAARAARLAGEQPGVAA